jgi:hypothetical protein
MITKNRKEELVLDILLITTKQCRLAEKAQSSRNTSSKHFRLYNLSFHIIITPTPNR